MRAMIVTRESGLLLVEIFLILARGLSSNCLGFSILFRDELDLSQSTQVIKDHLPLNIGILELEPVAETSKRIQVALVVRQGEPRILVKIRGEHIPEGIHYPDQQVLHRGSQGSESLEVEPSPSLA